MGGQARAKRPVSHGGLQTAFLIATCVCAAIPVYEVAVRPYIFPSSGLLQVGGDAGHQGSPRLVLQPVPRPDAAAARAQPLPEAAAPAPAAPAPAAPAPPPPAPAPPVWRGVEANYAGAPPPQSISLCPGQPKDGVTDSKSTRQRVTLIHIPRTGGTSAERCTKDEPDDVDRWGELNAVLHNGGKRTPLNSKGAKCYGQHAPTTAIDFYRGKDTFCVVRSPYDRLVSIFGYRVKMFQSGTGDCTPENMNERLIQWLNQVKRSKNPQTYLHDCHMLPQVAWVKGWDAENGVVQRDITGCNHVLRFKNLTREFNALMKEKGYHYRLGNTKLMSGADACSRLKKDLLWQETRTLIEEVYREDFELLDFPHMEGPAPSRPTPAPPPETDDGGPRRGRCPGQKESPPGADGRVRPVALIHIPRTGGTTMEECTHNEQANAYKWGTLNTDLHKPERVYINKKGARCWGQHVPPNVVDFFGGRETFCVVRDPYTRLISEFGHRQAMYSDLEGPCTVENMNGRLTEWMLRVKGLTKDHGPNPWGKEHYLNDCHMLPQAAYVYGWNPDSGEVDRGLRSCHRQLRFESMHADFSRLMEERGYPYRLATSKFQKSNDACGRLGKADLWPSTQELVQELYRMDFELLNYSL